MPDRLEKLKAMLADLETELDSLGSMDTETRQVLEEAVSEIQAALEAKDPTEIEHETLADRLRNAAEEFESSHPTLFGVVSRTIDALGQMGI